MPDYIALLSKINTFINPPAPDGGPSGVYSNVEALYDGYFVYCKDGKCYRSDYTLSETGELVVGATVEVEEQFVPKGTTIAAESMSIDATGKLIDDGWTWPIEVVSEGLTKSPNADLSYWGVRNKKGYKYYTRGSIVQAANDKVFEARPLVYQPESDHTDWGQGKNVKKLAPNEESEMTFAMVTDTQAVERDGKMRLKGYAKLSRNTVGKAVREHLLKAAETGQKGVSLLDLSWTGPYKGVLINAESNTPIVQVQSFTEAVSIVPCAIGNAGGQFLAAESLSTKHTMKNPLIPGLIAALAAKNPKGIKGNLAKAAEAAENEDAGGSQDLETMVAQLYLDNNPAVGAMFESAEDFLKNSKAQAAIEAWLKDAVSEKTADTDNDGDTDGDTDNDGDTAKAAESAKFTKELSDIKRQLVISHLDKVLAESPDMPQAAKDKFRKSISARAAESVVTTAQIDNELRAEKDFLATLEPTRSKPTSITIGADRLKEAVYSTLFFNARPEVAKAAEGLIGFNPLDRKHYGARFTSFKKLLSVLNSDAPIEDILSPRDARAAESYTTNVNNGLILDALNMRGLAAFYSPKWDEYKLVTTPDTSSDFRVNHSLNIGMPSAYTTTVDYTADFPEGSIDGEEDVNDKIAGHGNIFSIRFDQIQNDVIGQIAQAPEKWFYAYKKGLFNTVFNIYQNASSTNFSDGNPLIGTTHKNRVTGDPSLSGPAVIAARNQMLQVPELGSNDASGLVPSMLIYGPNLHEAAYKILTPHAGMANEVGTADQSLGLRGVEVLNWTNNYWFLQSDEVESIKIYYLNGKQEPELAQENPLAAISFTQMALRYRIHFPWLVLPVNFRPLVGSFAS